MRTFKVRGCHFALAGLSLLCSAEASADGSKLDVSGDVRLYGDGRAASSSGPLAQGRALSSSLQAPASWSGQAEATLKASWSTVTGAVTLRDTESQTDVNRRRVVLDELATTNEIGPGLHATLGKKVVSWDVGYAFRPNDLVQQEARRTLVPMTLEGRPLGMVEGFLAESAWSVVAFRQESRPQDQRPGAIPENVLAGRLYARVDGADVYAFGRAGTETGGGAGAAFSIVANDEIEVHGSAARTGRFSSLRLTENAPLLAASYPYESAQQHGAAQVLVGMTWTNESKLSVIAEAWYDGTAPSKAFWDGWTQRGQAIAATVRASSPAGLVAAAAGNLGWQANVLQATSARRQNLFLRASWTHEEWQPALDVLFTPEDRGYVMTAGLTWQGDRVRVDFGTRLFGGAAGSVLRQVPIKSITYAGLIVPF